jgi:hypothetical protein
MHGRNPPQTSFFSIQSLLKVESAAFVEITLPVHILISNRHLRRDLQKRSGSKRTAGPVKIVK